MALASVVAFPASVSAGEPFPTAEVTSTACGDGGGIITVNIADESSETYDVLLDGEFAPLGEEITDTDEGTDPFLIGPLPDGDYNVQVIWNTDGGDQTILDEDVTIDCVEDPAPEPEPEPTPEPEAAPVTAAPTYTG